MRVPFCRREKASYIKLRRLGYSTNTIADAFGRSYSVIYRALKRNGLTHTDMRKLPSRVKLLSASRQRQLIRKFFRMWELWSLGEGEKPP